MRFNSIQYSLIKQLLEYSYRIVGKRRVNEAIKLSTKYPNIFRYNLISPNRADLYCINRAKIDTILIRNIVGLKWNNNRKGIS